MIVSLPHKHFKIGLTSTFYHGMVLQSIEQTVTNNQQIIINTKKTRIIPCNSGMINADSTCMSYIISSKQRFILQVFTILTMETKKSITNMCLFQSFKSINCNKAVNSFIIIKVKKIKRGLTMNKFLKTLSVIATVGMVFLLLGGALVTKTGSEDGCGDSWPLCEGQVIPSEFTFEMVVELSHRLVSGGVGIVVLVLSFLAWKKYRESAEIKFLAFISVFFLFIQALVGAAAVMWGQSDFVLAAHFGISLISFASVFLLMLLIFEIDQKLNTKQLFIQKKHRIEILLLSIYTMIVVYTGALVRHTESNLVCGSWPFCFNSSPFAFASYSGQQWIQMGHRLAAGILFIWTVVLFVKIIKHYKSSKVMVWGWSITLTLISLQVMSGALIIFTMLNLGIALVHALFISCYFGMLSYFLLLSYRSIKYEKAVLNKSNVKLEEKVITPDS